MEVLEVAVRLQISVFWETPLLRVWISLAGTAPFSGNPCISAQTAGVQQDPVDWCLSVQKVTNSKKALQLEIGDSLKDVALIPKSTLEDLARVQRIFESKRSFQRKIVKCIHLHSVFAWRYIANLAMPRKLGCGQPRHAAEEA